MNWDNVEVCSWVATLNPKYSKVFEQNKVTGKELFALRSHDLVNEPYGFEMKEACDILLARKALNQNTSNGQNKTADKEKTSIPAEPIPSDKPDEPPRLSNRFTPQINYDDEEESPYRMSQLTINYKKRVQEIKIAKTLKAQTLLQSMREQNRPTESLSSSDETDEVKQKTPVSVEKPTRHSHHTSHDSSSSKHRSHHKKDSSKHSKSKKEKTKKDDSRNEDEKQDESLGKEGNDDFKNFLDNARTKKTSKKSRSIDMTERDAQFKEFEKEKENLDQTILVVDVNKKLKALPRKPALAVFPSPFSMYLKALNDGEFDYWSTMQSKEDSWDKECVIDQKYLLVDKKCIDAHFTLEISKSSPKRNADFCNEHRIVEPDTDYPLFSVSKNNLEPKNITTYLIASDLNPVIVSVLRFGPFKRVIIRTKYQDYRGVFLASEKEDFERICPRMKSSKLIRVKSSLINDDLVKLEQMLMVTRYKFGIIYVEKNQREENEFYSNRKVSAAFDEFLDLLGRIELKGYTGYRGGLDVKNNNTGTHSVAIPDFKGYGIMFHVSTLLPFQEFDPQRVERKRHIGNDVVVVIFKEREDENDFFNPLTLTSHFNSVFFIITPITQNNKTTHYMLNIVNKPNINPYVPYFPATTPVFAKEEFKDFLLTKLINAERTAMHSGEFLVNYQNTRAAHLSQICNKYK